MMASGLPTFTDDQMAAFDEVRKAAGYGQSDIADAAGGLKSLLNCDLARFRPRRSTRHPAGEYEPICGERTRQSQG